MRILSVAFFRKRPMKRVCGDGCSLWQMELVGNSAGKLHPVWPWKAYCMDFAGLFAEMR